MDQLTPILPVPLIISSQYKTINQKGNLVYEYNPFRNYRLSTTQIEYKNYLYSLEEIEKKFNIKLYKKIEDDKYEHISNIDSIKIETDILRWKKNDEFLEISKSPIIRRKGELVDFITNELKFNIHNPVNILPQYSYDNSVNLIVNDGYNPPRLINSRFSTLGKNKYQIVDRRGDNDTNIYDQGDQFDIDTSLYKKTNTIPTLSFKGTFSGGSMPIGNYHFYFKYVDADGNESDFIAESGLVSIFIGIDPLNIRSGFRQENSYKGILFQLSDLDSGYQYISIYYTVATSDINENTVTSAYKLDQKFIIGMGNKCDIKITGYEDKTEITTSEINLQYQVVGSAYTQEQCQNMLFLGNVQKPDINYQELEDISLRFLPTIVTEEYDIAQKIDENYDTCTDFANSYYNTNFIYNKVGYYPDEIYRLGIVYILKDNTLSPVFNVRGIKNTPTYLEYEENTSKYSLFNLYKDNTRQYIEHNEETYIISGDNSSTNLENSKGVIYITNNAEKPSIYGLKIYLYDESNCLKALQDLGVKGYFFVRQKRIPTTLCEAFIIGVDKQSHTPVIPVGDKYIAEGFLTQESNNASNGQILSHDYSDHILKTTRSNINTAALCPEYDINSPYLNTLFNGDKFVLIKNKIQPEQLQQSAVLNRHYYTNKFKDPGDERSETCNIIGVEDNTKLVAIQNTFYSARAGEAEEAYQYEYFKYKNKITKATNLIRGSFGPFLGVKESNFIGSMVTIKIPNYSENSMQEYFKIRYSDQAPYYAISDRYSIDDYENRTYYRGDSYICQVTHRINRNFQDPTAPTNDLIVDEKCWKDNYKVEDGIVNKEKFDKINLGDVNAVQLGQWVTFVVRSNFNLCLRAVDNSNTDEIALTGVSRSFYPNIPISTAGVYKIPESLCYNKGFQKSTSERVNFNEPETPAIKNDFTNRILYSDISVNDAFKNGYRTFQGTHYRDYTKAYGQIVKLVETNGSLLCVCEHGILLIPVNERTLAGKSEGGDIFINTSNVLPENPLVISDTFGSQWQESIIKTSKGIYGVDTFAKKIWRTTGRDIECISDFKIQGFLNRNITLTERETEPIIGIRNVKTHYNAFKHDVMFTFYDNLYDYEEKVWNLCWNELLNNGQGAFITFYSWVPSFSENIYNSYFSFDRNTSKQIAKLGISNGSFDGGNIILKNNIIDGDDWSTELDIADNLKPKEGEYSISFKFAHDNFKNYKLFKIETDENGTSWLKLDLTNADATYEKIKSELYELNTDGSIKLDEETGRRIQASNPKNTDKIVRLLNIEAEVNIKDTTNTDYKQQFNNNKYINAGEYKAVVAVIPQYNLQFLTTDFWKHGQANTIDIADEILPTNWYGKQHPFEFEFVVADNQQAHKIFNNLEIISNSAEPESFHYEIVGDCYNFAKDKKNMYIRQEATKELYQYNGSDISYDHDYSNLQSYHRPLSNTPNLYDKSTIMPLYYNRNKSVNDIEDYYHLKDGKNKDFSAMSGAEIVKNDSLQEYHIWNHAKAINLQDGGRLRGNMQYKEDKWYVQVNPINIVQQNEPAWNSKDDFGGNLENIDVNKIPIEINQNPIPNKVLEKGSLEIPSNLADRAIVQWKWEDSQIQEVKPKDKWIKIRIRYSGKKLAVITAVRTLYSISYS